jgi:hypothetical protein
MGWSADSVRRAVATGRWRVAWRFRCPRVLPLGRIAVVVLATGGLGLELLLFLFLLGKLALAFFVSVVGSSQISLSGLW